MKALDAVVIASLGVVGIAGAAKFTHVMARQIGARVVEAQLTGREQGRELGFTEAVCSAESLGMLAPAPNQVEVDHVHPPVSDPEAEVRMIQEARRECPNPRS